MFLKALTVAGLATFEIYAAIPAGFAFGLSPWTIFFASVIGGLTGVFVAAFLGNNIQSMHVIAEASNPSCWFYEKMGGRKMHNNNGSLNHGNYEWYNLKQLVSICSHT